MKKLEIGNSIYTDHYQRAKLGSNVEYINHPSMTQVPTRNQQPQNQKSAPQNPENVSV